MKTKLMLGLAVLGTTFAFANSKFSIEDKIDKTNKTEKSVDDIAYVWEVKTSKNTITGTSKTYLEAKQKIKMLTKNYTVMYKRITPVYVNTSKASKVYIWEVKTNQGYARGIASTEKEANKSIKLMSTGSVLSSKIVESYSVKK